MREKYVEKMGSIFSLWFLVMHLATFLFNNFIHFCMKYSNMETNLKKSPKQEEKQAKHNA